MIEALGWSDNEKNCMMATQLELECHYITRIILLGIILLLSFLRSLFQGILGAKWNIKIR